MPKGSTGEPLGYHPAMRISLPALLAACVLATIPTVAVAGPVILHGPDDDAVSAATRAKEVLGSGEFRVAGAVSALLGDDPGALVVIGGAVIRCDGEARVDFGAALREATRWVDQMEYSSAIRAIDAVVDALPCGGGDGTSTQLFEAWFLRGIAQFNDGDEAAAKASFARATTLDPARKWDDAFPWTPKPVYLEALQETLARPTVLVRVAAEGVVLDGTPLSAGASVMVQPGEHVLTQGAATFGLTVVPDSVGVRLTTVGAVVEAVLGGTEQGAAWLREVSLAEQWDEVLVVDGEDVRRFRGYG